METWAVIFITVTCLLLALFIKSIFNFFSGSQLQPKKFTSNLPPGPTSMITISLLTILRRTAPELETMIRSFFATYGPIITLPFSSSSTPTVVVSSRILAHQALVQRGQIFADRPKATLTGKITTSNQHNINSASYGHTWRSLRRNFVTFLHPCRVKSFSTSRRRALQILTLYVMADYDSKSKLGEGTVKLFDHLQHAMFSLLALICFGEKLDEESIKELNRANQRILESGSRFQILDFYPILAKTLLYHQWREFVNMRRDLEEVMIPLIRARKLQSANSEEEDSHKNNNYYDDLPTYVDTLFKLELEEDGETRSPTEEEMVTMCTEFVTAGVDTTSAVLQWIMANIIKYPDIQAKLFEEIKSVVEEDEEVQEEDLPKMPYLRAVVLEGLRRHPPLHFLLPHSTMEEAELGGYTVPKGSTVFFMLSEMGWDPEVWEEPMKFKPERFLARGGEEEALDITGNRGIKMMPFGAGRRICPGYAMGIMHLEYFVANLILKFEWKPVPGDDVDLTEDHNPFVVMKHPIQAIVSPREEQSPK
ncbi:hypothetical protein Dimus_029071 [Dionaea muscipula]